MLHWFDSWVTTWNKEFSYLIATKHKKTQYQAVKCEVDLEWAMQMFIDDIHNYFYLLTADDVVLDKPLVSWKRKYFSI